MSIILRISLVLLLSALIPSFVHAEPTFKTCGPALSKRFTRVCSKSTSSHGNISRSLKNYDQASVNQSDLVFENGSANQMSRELIADCCTRSQGCSNGWIRQRFCSPRGRSKRSWLAVWDRLYLPNQWENDCFQTNTFYYDWWRNNFSEIVAAHNATDPLECYNYCKKNSGCLFFSYSKLNHNFVQQHTCILRSASGGGAMQWIYSTSGPWDCDQQAELAKSSPIDTCIEFANQNTQFLRQPKDYNLPSMILFIRRFEEPKQFNMLTVKLKVPKKFTLYIAGEINDGYLDSALTKGIDPNTLFKNAYAIDTRFTASRPHVVNNYMTDGAWSGEQWFPFNDILKGTIDEIQIWFLPDHIETYIHIVYPDQRREISGAQLDRPAWFDTVEHIWFTGDDDTKVYNLFHCTSGLTVPLSFASGYQLDLPNMKAGNMFVNYVVFYGIAYGTRDGDFQIEFLANEAPNYDTVFTFSVQFTSGKIAYNSQINGSYGEEIKFYDFPFNKSPYGNNNFTRLDFMFLDDHINVAVNGFKFHPFTYRTYKSLDTVAVRLAHVDPNDKFSEIQFVIMGIDAKWIDNLN